MAYLRSSLSLLPLLAAASCAERTEPVSEDSKRGKPLILTTFYPTQYFAERISGGFADVVCPLPEDADPIFWKPDAAAIARYQKADLIVLNGAGFEKWVAHTSLPESRLVDTTASLEGGFLQYENAVEHKHGPEGAHTHEGADGHTWVDPINAIAQARAIMEAVSERFPEHADASGAAFEALSDDLGGLGTALKELSGALGNRPLLASHPAYNYLVRRYGWNMQNLDLDPGEMPDKASVEGIRGLLAKHPATLILWESEPLPEISGFLKRELGLTSLTFSPCEGPPESAADDYLTVMKRNLSVLEKAAKP